MTNTTTQILILHGRSLDLVDELRKIFVSLGLTAETVLDQPANGLPQHDRVRHRIMTCKIPLVLATYAEKGKSSGSPRPNVIHELTICSKERLEDTIVLQEVRDGHPVDLGSNLDGQLVIIQFQSGNLHLAYPRLFREMNLESLLTHPPESSRAHTTNTDNPMIEIMDKMDSLWKQFDGVFFKIHREDASTFYKYGDSLDKFFINYWNIFHFSVKNNNAGPELIKTATEQYNHSLNLAVQLWRDATDALMAKAAKLMEDRRKTRLASHVTSFQEAENKLRSIRKDDNIESRIKAYTEACNTLYPLVQKIEASN